MIIEMMINVYSDNSNNYYNDNDHADDHDNCNDNDGNVTCKKELMWWVTNVLGRILPDGEIVDFPRRTCVEELSGRFSALKNDLIKDLNLIKIHTIRRY